MEFPRPTLRGVFVLTFGVLVGVLGLYMCRVSWTRMTGVGLALTGFGLMSLGLTNGFTDYSPIGRTLYKLGLIAFGVGVPLAIYSFYTGAY